jgi:ABC-2 type transport system ATP-binding protein
LLEARNLTKFYGRVPAVRGVSFTVRPYEVLGYLGPNGSGKSTTANMITGLLEPAEGEILFDGRNVKEDPVAYKRRIGYVPEIPQLYPFLSGLEYLQLIGRLRSLSPEKLDRRIEDFLALFSMHEDRHVAISSYSKGMRQKILITAALLHNPDLIIFDEPLSGLDVTSALIFRNLVKTLSNDGKIIMYSSHVLEVVEKVCSNVIILNKGAIVANDSVERLRTMMSLPNLEDIFGQLVQQEDTDRTARDIVHLMKQPL